MWHLATPFLVFFSFLDSTISGHVTQISDFLRYRKIKVTDFSEAAKFWKVLLNDHYKILCKLASGHALTCLSDHLQAQNISTAPQICWYRTSDFWTRHFLFIRLEMFSLRENGANFPFAPILYYLYRH